MSLPANKDLHFTMLKMNLKEQIRRGDCRLIDVGEEGALGIAYRQGQWLLYRFKIETTLQIDAQATLAAWRSLPLQAGPEALWKSAKIRRRARLEEDQ
jgi:hypothetical protein